MLYICPGCGISKPRDAEHFHRCSSRKDGFQSHCKLCKNVERKARRDARKAAGLSSYVDPLKEAAAKEAAQIRNYETYHADIEKSRADHRARYAANAEEERLRARNRYHEDVEASRAMGREYYRTPEGKARASKSNKAWREANPHYDHFKRLRRMVRLLGSQENFTEADIIHLHVTQLGLCHYCQRVMTSRPGPLQTWIDHMDPICHGGSNAAWNIVLACREWKSQT